MSDETVAVEPEPQVESLSPQYAQLCGILAGFAFVGFSVYLAPASLPAEAANVTASLFAAFVTLMLLAVLYALMAADRSPNRVLTSIYVYGLPFGLASITLFYTLTLMALEHPALHATVQIGRLFVLVVGPAVVLARINGGATMLKAGRRSRFMPKHASAILVAILAAVGLVVMFVPVTVNWLHGSGTAPAYIALGSAVVAGGLSPVIADRAAHKTLRLIWIDGYLILGFLALVCSTCLSAAALT